MSFVCPVCGFPGLIGRPRGLRLGGPSDEICRCCGYQFGYTDDLLEIDDATWRERWIAEGMPWRDLEPPPVGWDPKTQLAALTTDRGDGSAERGQALTEYAVLLVIVAAVVALGIPHLIDTAMSARR
jgi:hypothetical protein